MQIKNIAGFMPATIWFAGTFTALSGAAVGTSTNLISGLSQYDGEHYIDIIARGYVYDPRTLANIAFFPTFPLCGRALGSLTGLDVAWALVVVANICLALGFIILFQYLAVRSTRNVENQFTLAKRLSGASTSPATYALLAFGLFPTTFFFHMAYSESLFVLVTIVALYAMEKQWPLLAVAVVIGFATATRSVGVALLCPFAIHIWNHRRGNWQAAITGACLLPLACWGLLAYMLFQYVEFGDALAFAKIQANWSMREPAAVTEKLLALLAWEPIWKVYDTDFRYSWHFFGERNPILSMQFMNPIYFLVTAGLLAIGVWKRWLTTAEITLSIGLLAIPYFMRGFEMCMNSQGRFAAVVFPQYIVMGELLARAPRWLALAALTVSAAFMWLYSALFAAGKPFF